MKVEVRLFARYREAAGRDRVEIDLPEGGTVETAWEAVSRRFPALGQYRPFTLFALREDHIAGLDPYLPLLPTRLKTTFRLDLLGEAAARRSGPGRFRRTTRSPPRRDRRPPRPSPSRRAPRL